MTEDARDDDRADPEAEPHEPRLSVIKGSPWTVTGGRREKWASEEFVAQNAVDIRQVGDPVLHSPARKPKLPRAELESLIARMFASMIAARGVGIAAPQIGVPLRICIIDVDEVGIVAIDPEIEWTSEEVDETSEGCLSVRGLYGMLERPVAARLSATDPAGKRFTIEGVELGAQCMLHETDHLEGRLYVDLLRSRVNDLFPVEAPAPGEEEAPVSGRRRPEPSASAAISEQSTS